MHFESPFTQGETLSTKRHRLLLGYAPNYKTEFEDHLLKASPSLGGRREIEIMSMRGKEEGENEIVIDIQNKLVSNLN